MVNDKPAATFHPNDDDLPPLAVLVEMLDEVVEILNGLEELVIDHRRAAGDDHHTLERLQVASTRIGQAWAAVMSARKAIRP